MTLGSFPEWARRSPTSSASFLNLLINPHSVFEMEMGSRVGGRILGFSGMF